MNVTKCDCEKKGELEGVRNDEFIFKNDLQRLSIHFNYFWLRCTSKIKFFFLFFLTIDDEVFSFIFHFFLVICSCVINEILSYPLGQLLNWRFRGVFGGFFTFSSLSKLEEWMIFFLNNRRVSKMLREKISIMFTNLIFFL